jgi:alkanesulfonate monooxygenase SsuD/methylene tetrahydromethanopterin reductase-like flavin-dependent oxidoreductase (luciferase family)
MLAAVSCPTESWFPLEAQRSAQREAAQIDRLLRAASAAAADGGERVWLSAPRDMAAENDSLRLAVAVALHCETLRVVATGLRSESWIRLAEDAATADGLCGGRLELAFEAVPEVSALERLRAAWSGAPVEIPANAHSEAVTIEVHPRPVRRDGPPLWVEAPGPAEAARAVDLDLGAIVSDVSSARAGLEAAGGDLARVAIVEPGSSALEELGGLPRSVTSLLRVRVE